MIQHKNILIAFDGSDNGLKALETAKKLSLDNDAQLTVVYVHDKALEHPVNVGTTPAGEEYMYQQFTVAGTITKNTFPDHQHTVIVQEEMPQRVMATAQAKLAEVPNVHYENLVGKPATEIVDYANNNDTDVIVIGHRGIGALKKMLKGSVSEKVTDEANCSVFVVK